MSMSYSTHLPTRPPVYNSSCVACTHPSITPALSITPHAAIVYKRYICNQIQAMSAPYATGPRIECTAATGVIVPWRADACRGRIGSPWCALLQDCTGLCWLAYPNMMQYDTRGTTATIQPTKLTHKHKPSSQTHTRRVKLSGLQHSHINASLMSTHARPRARTQPASTRAHERTYTSRVAHQAMHNQL